MGLARHFEQKDAKVEQRDEEVFALEKSLLPLRSGSRRMKSVLERLIFHPS